MFEESSSSKCACTGVGLSAWGILSEGENRSLQAEVVPGFELQFLTEGQVVSVAPLCNAKSFIVSSSLSLISHRFKMKRAEPLSRLICFLSDSFILVTLLLMNYYCQDTKSRVKDSSRLMLSRIVDCK